MKKPSFFTDPPAAYRKPPDQHELESLGFKNIDEFLDNSTGIRTIVGGAPSRESGKISKKEKESPVDTAAKELGEAFRKANISQDQARNILNQIISDVYASQPQPQLPTAAPELYADRADKNEKPPAFIKRVYASWLGNGLKRTDILHLDRQLYMGLHQWSRRNGLPENFELPTRSQMVTQELERASAEDLQKAQRLSVAAYHRRARVLKNG